MKRTTHANRMLRALEWIQACFGVETHFSAVFVRSQVSGSSSAAGERPLPKPARIATVEMLVCFEELVFSAPSSTLQCWAGVQGHGVLRWSDLQHSKDLTLTDDALMGITWRMKKFSVQVPLAALRIGVSGRDWAVKWLAVLSYHGLLGKDFVILAPSHDLKSFKDAVANFYHCQSMLRTILLHSGFTASEAMTFSCHSWRHLFPTAGHQLRLSDETLNDMGHWAPNSGMPQTYDSAACVSELTGKATVRRAFQGGWSMVGPGCVPLPVASQDSTCPVQKKQRFHQTKLQTSWSRLCRALSWRNRLRPGLWSTMANEGYICEFWVHIHFAVCGNAGALLSQHLSRTLQEKVSWNLKI